MGAQNIRNKAEELKGAAKEKLGDATDNEELEAEGAWQKNKAQAEQHARDAEKRYAEQAKRDVSSQIHNREATS
jgi:uncharacterized protein YjbJ (UPF0337 family)